MVCCSFCFYGYPRDVATWISSWPNVHNPGGNSPRNAAWIASTEASMGPTLRSEINVLNHSAWVAARDTAENSLKSIQASPEIIVQIAYRISESIVLLELVNKDYIRKLFNHYYDWVNQLPEEGKVVTGLISHSEVGNFELKNRLLSQEYWVETLGQYEGLKPESKVFLKPFITAIQTTSPYSSLE